MPWRPSCARNRYTVSWTDVNGNLVCAMGRHGFLVYFPRNTIWRLAAEEKVASALNKLADRTFLDVLSPRDKSSMADLTADFSRRIHKWTHSEEEEEPGN